MIFVEYLYVFSYGNDIIRNQNVLDFTDIRETTFTRATINNIVMNMQPSSARIINNDFSGFFPNGNNSFFGGANVNVNGIGTSQHRINISQNRLRSLM